MNNSKGSESESFKMGAEKIMRNFTGASYGFNETLDQLSALHDQYQAKAVEEAKVKILQDIEPTQCLLRREGLDGKGSRSMSKRKSIQSTYDSQKDGFQYRISTSVNDKSIGDGRNIQDPFVNHTVRVSLWDTFKGLLKGGVTVGVFINGKNNRIVEDVMELDDQYLGQNATRRDDFNNHIMNKAIEHIDNEERKEKLN